MGCCARARRLRRRARTHPLPGGPAAVPGEMQHLASDAAVLSTFLSPRMLARVPVWKAGEDSVHHAHATGMQLVSETLDVDKPHVPLTHRRRPRATTPLRPRLPPATEQPPPPCEGLGAALAPEPAAAAWRWLLQLPALSRRAPSPQIEPSFSGARLGAVCPGAAFARCCVRMWFARTTLVPGGRLDRRWASTPA